MTFSATPTKNPPKVRVRLVVVNGDRWEGTLAVVYSGVRRGRTPRIPYTRRYAGGLLPPWPCEAGRTPRTTQGPLTSPLFSVVPSCTQEI